MTNSGSYVRVYLATIGVNGQGISRVHLATM